jgi:uncharacterized protein YidB (DUF937 family)
MGLLDQITGFFGGDQARAVESIKNLLDPNGPLGGLDGLVKKFQDAGLGDKIQSWISGGENLPISADEVQRVLPDTVRDLAGETGKSTNEVAGTIADTLPEIVNKVTPDGVLPDASSLMDKLGGLSKIFS